ncbi:Peroxin-3 [Basidiobolus meristosporus CBS 931.73]|uniref:Peroxin-3 n=1 Tax=Basidiobolus meristosporus CBS 931.73 TaxID=1314790 RepID=A0A1Y1Z7F4_9FUNG|nr:Peroxin-3 [Basidiobolus meristosporus CBS 931.73]|eukprot:ORY06183.1 Peroxin-3 [Basidiobolus meristosporus CBS 931.73]
MLDSLVNFGRRHRRGFFVTAGFFGSIYIFGQYAKRKVVELQEKTVRDSVAKENLKRRFEQNQRDCLMTVLSLLPTLGEQLISERGPTHSSPGPSGQTATVGGPENRKYVREKAGRSRALNLLGRFIYVDSVLASSERDKGRPLRLESTAEDQRRLSREVERKFLTYSWWLLHVGWKRCVEDVTQAVREVLGDMPLKKPLHLQDVIHLFQEIRTRLEFTESQTPANMRNLLLPDDLAGELEVLREGSGLDDPQIDGDLRMLLDETKDFLDSPDFVVVRQACLDEAFSLLNYNLRSVFLGNVSPTAKVYEMNSPEDPATEKAVSLAALLPIISRQVHQIINGVPNEFVEMLSTVKELQTYSAIVYSSFNLEDQ